MIKIFKNIFFTKKNLIDSIFRQYISFFIIGMFCFSIDFSILYGLKEIAGLNIYFAVIVAFTIATYINYLLNLRYVFEGGRHAKHKEMLFFFAIATGGLLLTLLFMFALVDLLFIYYLFAKVITVFLVSLYSFFSRKYFVFSK